MTPCSHGEESYKGKAGEESWRQEKGKFCALVERLAKYKGGVCLFT